MILLLALMSCGEDVTVLGVPVTAPDEPEPGSGTIATAAIGEDPLRPVRPAGALPVGEPLVADCFGADLDSDLQIIRGTRRATGGGGGPGAGSPPQAAPKPSAPAPSVEAPAAAPAPPMDGFAGGKKDEVAKGVELPMKTRASEAGEGARREDKEQEPRRRAPVEEAELDDARDLATTTTPVSRPSLDWGATVYLSNDDSMSLASAQRTLYAVMNGSSLPPGQIRPHELLNYFSFDTVPVPDGQLFSVLGAAEVQDDTLTMSLAVRGAMPERQPLDLTVVIDRSGSMSAEGRMDYLKRGLRVMTEQLERGDRVDVVLFDDRVCTPLQGWVKGRDDQALLSSVVDRLAPRGGTDIDIGLREAYRVQASRSAADTHLRNRRVLLITDAMMNTGNVDEDLVSEVGRQFEEHGIRVTGVGVGREFNDALLDRLTEKGKGGYVYLGSEAVVDRVFGTGFRSLTETIAHDVQFALDLPDSLAMKRFYGEEASTDPEDVQPINYYAGTTQLFLQDLAIGPGGPVRSDPVVLTVSYRDARTGEPATQELRTTVGALLDADPHNLRKGKALMAWTDLLTARALGADPCANPLQAYTRASRRVEGDAEIAFVNGLTGRLCHVDLAVPSRPGVSYKVKLDSDIPIAEVALACGGESLSERLSGGDTVARFDGARPGECTLTLQGSVPLVATVTVPETGGDLRCLVRGGRLSCS